jgi:hypothetical protein
MHRWLAHSVDRVLHYAQDDGPISEADRWVETVRYARVVKEVFMRPSRGRHINALETVITLIYSLLFKARIAHATVDVPGIGYSESLTAEDVLGSPSG